MGEWRWKLTNPMTTSYSPCQFDEKANETCKYEIKSWLYEVGSLLRLRQHRHPSCPNKFARSANSGSRSLRRPKSTDPLNFSNMWPLSSALPDLASPGRD
jgi:hypothetical protein